MIPLLKQLAQKNTKIAKQRILILHMKQFYFILFFWLFSRFSSDIIYYPTYFDTKWDTIIDFNKTSLNFFISIVI